MLYTNKKTIIGKTCKTPDNLKSEQISFKPDTLWACNPPADRMKDEIVIRKINTINLRPSAKQAPIRIPIACFETDFEKWQGGTTL